MDDIVADRAPERNRQPVAARPSPRGTVWDGTLSAMSAPWFDRLDDLARSSLRVRGVTEQVVRTAAGPIHRLEIAGSGALPPVVLIHGLGSCAADLLWPFAGLSRHVRRVVAIDLPGHGRSPLTGRLDPAAVKAGIAEALADLEPAVLFGNSLGGFVAARYAIDRPERARGLFLASPGGAPLGPEGRAALTAALNQALDGASGRFAEHVFARPTRFAGVVCAGVRARFSRPGVQAWIDRISDAEFLAADELRGLRMPVHLFWGRADRLLPDEARRFFLEHLRHAQVSEPEGYGHAPYLDAPRAFFRQLLAFVRSVDGRRADPRR
jgi:pimeloyl-ACP methyl ester carboxylesterase